LALLLGIAVIKSAPAKGGLAMKVDYDAITVGSGLGGAALEKVLAENGVRVLVVERETTFKDRVRITRPEDQPFIIG
jgi:choline dehydrogenase-like flavoprotein